LFTSTSIGPSACSASSTAASVAATSAPATLEQDPDFYLWLASSDAVALASE
jgi:hypothetical protein